MDSPGSVGSDLRRQNEELRARLAGESADHKRRLDAYRRAQQGQAALVSRLQAKVFFNFQFYKATTPTVWNNFGLKNVLKIKVHISFLPKGVSLNV